MSLVKNIVATLVTGTVAGVVADSLFRRKQKNAAPDAQKPISSPHRKSSNIKSEDGHFFI